MEKLVKIQKELKAPKGQYNKFGNFHYRSAEDILEAVKPLLDGAILTLQDEIVVVGGEGVSKKTLDKEGNVIDITEQKVLRTYVKATATFTDGEFTISTVAYAREPQTKSGMDAPQITGTASSYARKYALNGLFCIDDNKDADTDEYAEQVKAGEEQEKQKTVEEYIAEIKKCTTAKAVDRLFFEWSKIYKSGTAEYKTIGNVSWAKKKEIGE